MKTQLKYDVSAYNANGQKACSLTGVTFDQADKFMKSTQLTTVIESHEKKPGYQYENKLTDSQKLELNESLQRSKLPVQKKDIVQPLCLIMAFLLTAFSMALCLVGFFGS